MATNADRPHNKGGRPSKGQRSGISVYTPVDHAAVYASRSQELGLSLSDYYVLRMAEAEGLPVPDYISNVIDINRNRRLDGQGGSAMAI